MKLKRKQKRMLALAERVGLKVIVVKDGGPYSRDYTGSHLVISRKAIERVLLHEIGHWVVAKCDDTDHLKDYGIVYGQRDVDTCYGPMPRDRVEQEANRIEAALKAALEV